MTERPGQPGVLLHVGAQRFELRSGEPRELPDAAIDQLHARVRCTACAAASMLSATPVCTAHDDDHVAYTDVFYDSELVGTCAGCGRALRLRIGCCVTTQRLIRSAQAELDPRWLANGCELISPTDG